MNSTFKPGDRARAIATPRQLCHQGIPMDKAREFSGRVVEISVSATDYDVGILAPGDHYWWLLNTSIVKANHYAKI